MTPRPVGRRRSETSSSASRGSWPVGPLLATSSALCASSLPSAEHHSFGGSPSGSARAGGPWPLRVDGIIQHIRYVNRITSCAPEGIQETAACGVGGGRPGVRIVGITTPLVKEQVVDEPLAMRLGHLSQDLADLQRAIRELAKGTSAPTERHMRILKKLERYLAARSCSAQRIPRHDMFTH